jgi:TolA-binding protein
MRGILVMKESDVLFQKGMELLKSGQYKQAEELFRKARATAVKSI